MVRGHGDRAIGEDGRHEDKEVIDMALVRWDPFRELTTLQNEVNRLFSRAGGGDVAERQSWTPSVDVIEAQDAIKLKAELAGMEPEDISSRWTTTCSR